MCKPLRSPPLHKHVDRSKRASGTVCANLFSSKHLLLVWTRSLITPAETHDTRHIHERTNAVYLLTHNERLKLICEYEPAYGPTPGGTRGTLWDSPFLASQAV